MQTQPKRYILKFNRMAKKILLIEDDLDIQRIYSTKLSANGFEVALAVDADQGFDSAKADTPSLILLDIMLPGKMNGFELLKKLKSDDELKKVPVVVLTNLDTEKEEALKLGAVDYFIKANTELSQVIEKASKFAK